MQLKTLFCLHIGNYYSLVGKGNEYEEGEILVNLCHMSLAQPMPAQLASTRKEEGFAS